MYIRPHQILSQVNGFAVYDLQIYFFFVQNTFHPYAFSWNLISVAWNSHPYQKSLINRNFLRKTSRLHKSNFWWLDRLTIPNNLWLKSMIHSSTQRPFPLQCGGYRFDAPYPSVYPVCAGSLGMPRTLIWAEQGWEEKVERCSSGICQLMKWRFLLFMRRKGSLVWSGCNARSHVCVLCGSHPVIKRIHNMVAFLKYCLFVYEQLVTRVKE